jgi:esterase
MILQARCEGAGPAVVLLHGLFGAGRNLGGLARGLSGQARVISFDLRNHGQSGHAAAMDYETMAADVAESLAGQGVERAAIVGHSMGGKTAMALALSYPALVARLAVLDIAPVSYGAAHGQAAYVVAMRGLPLVPDLTRAAADAALAAAVPEPPLRAFLLNNLVLGAAPHWRLGLGEIAAALPDLMAWRDPPGAPPYPGPALFLRGGASDYVPDSAHAPIMQRFPNAKLQTVAGASHWLHADHPAEVLEALRRFLFA